MPISLKFVVRSTLALLGIGFAALLFVVTATMWLSERAQTHLRDVDAARELRRTATALRTSLLTAESSQRGYILTGNEIYLAPYDNAKSETLAEMGRLKMLLGAAAISLEAEDRLSAGVAEQTSNTAWLRWTSAASAIVIILVVSGVLTTLHRYTCCCMPGQ